MELRMLKKDISQIPTENHIDKLKILNIAPLLVSKAEIAPRDYIENPLSFLKK